MTLGVNFKAPDGVQEQLGIVIAICLDSETNYATKYFEKFVAISPKSDQPNKVRACMYQLRGNRIGVLTLDVRASRARL